MKEREIDKDTVVAYHEYMQGRIREELNGVFLGPVAWLFKIVLGIVAFALFCLVVGILVIALRHRHVYLWDWNHEFIGPFFIIMFFLCCALATFLTIEAKRKANAYRRDVSFRPIGDYGVAVVHRSKLSYDFQERDALKSGSGTPRALGSSRYPPGVSHDPQGRGPPRRDDRGPRVHGRPGYENRGYRDDREPKRYGGGRDRPPPRYEDSEKGRTERDEDRRRYEERRRYEDRRRQEGRGDEDRKRPGPDDDRRRPGPDDDRRRPPGPDDDRRRPGPDDDRRPPGPDDDRRRPPGPDDDRRRPGPDDDRRRPGPDDEERRRHEGRRPEDDDRRRYEEDRRRREGRRPEEEGRRYERRGEHREADPDAERRPPADDQYGPPGPGPHGQPPRVNLARELDDSNESEL